MAQQQQPQKKSSRKVGRNKRSPAHMRYVFERRWMKHKANRVARQMRKHQNYGLPQDMDEETRVNVQVMMLKKQK